MGDKTSHGGTVIGGDPTFTILGKAVARIGDMTSCPKCKGTFAIKSGLSGFMSMDHAPAVNGDKTFCGATLITSLSTSTADNTSGSAAGEGDESSGSGPAAKGSAASPAPAAGPSSSSPSSANRYQKHFVLQDEKTGLPMASVPYQIKTADGQVHEGTTDAGGFTQVVWTTSPEDVELTARPEAGEPAEPYHSSDDNEYSGM